MTVLNQADAIFLGDQAVDAVYLGSEKVWPAEAPPASYEDIVLADNPVVFWPLDDATGSTARDLAGTNAGTYTGTYTLGAAGLGGRAALALNGGYVLLPTAAFALLDPPSTTVELWARPDNLTNHMGLISKTTGTYFPNPWDVYSFASTGLMDARVGNGTAATGALSVTSTNPITANAWHHIVVAYEAQTASSGTLTHYLNGQPNGTGQHTTGAVANSASAGTLGIRSAVGGSAIQLPFRGTLQWAAVYDHTLTAQEVAAHHAAGRAA